MRVYSSSWSGRHSAKSSLWPGSMRSRLFVYIFLDLKAESKLEEGSGLTIKACSLETCLLQQKSASPRFHSFRKHYHQLMVKFPNAWICRRHFIFYTTQIKNLESRHVSSIPAGVPSTQSPLSAVLIVLCSIWLCWRRGHMWSSFWPCSVLAFLGHLSRDVKHRPKFCCFSLNVNHSARVDPPGKSWKIPNTAYEIEDLVNFYWSEFLSTPYLGGIGRRNSVSSTPAFCS